MKPRRLRKYQFIKMRESHQTMNAPAEQMHKHQALPICRATARRRRTRLTYQAATAGKKSAQPIDPLLRVKLNHRLANSDFKGKKIPKKQNGRETHTTISESSRTPISHKSNLIPHSGNSQSNRSAGTSSWASAQRRVQQMAGAMQWFWRAARRWWRIGKQWGVRNR